MSCATHKLISVMANSIMLLIAHMHYAIIGAKAICMQRCREFYFTANNGLNAGLFAVRDDLRINAPVSLVDAEDDGLASCSTTALAANSASTEVRFVQLDITTERRLSFAVSSHGLANQSQITIHCITIQSSQDADLCSSQIKGKEPKKLAKFSPRNLCTNELSRTNCHDLV